jgi:choice-of-anchor C domain-containing protein
MLRALFVAGLLAFVPICADADPVLINGSFELGPPIPTNDIDIAAGFTGIPGWTVFGGSIDYLGPPWNVSEGQRAVDLDGRDATFSGIAQTFATSIGEAYIVRFDLSGNPQGGPLIKQARVTVDSFTQDYAFDAEGQTLDALIWQPIEFSFLASSTSATLSFMSLTSTPNSYGALIDNVRVDTVPEPSSLLLFTAGLVATICANRRRGPRRTRNHATLAGRMLIALICLGGFSPSAQADPITIDFENLRTSDALVRSIGDVYSAAGFLLTASVPELSGNTPNFNTPGSSSSSFSGSTALANGNALGITTLTRIDGGLFNFLSIDLSEMPNFDPTGQPIDLGSFSATFFGIRADGSGVQATATVGPFPATTTYLLPGFTNVVSVEWAQGPGGVQGPTHNSTMSASNKYQNQAPWCCLAPAQCCWPSAVEVRAMLSDVLMPSSNTERRKALQIFVREGAHQVLAERLRSPQIEMVHHP